MYETANSILQSAQELRLSSERFRQVGPGRWRDLLDKILTRFTSQGPLNRSRLWLWEDFIQPTYTLQKEHTLETLLKLDEPAARVWLVFEDWDRTKRDGNFWLFEGDLAAAVSVLNNLYGIEFYIVSQSLDWLVAENHHDVLIGVGPHAIQALKAMDAT
ncbi:MAG TPA: DUF6756 family protein [Thermoanaerobaculia bacterium]|jgi:hypothetical protein|nr:DUF6756 family protein [Thermoanaerobaculia bacterium]